MDSRSIVQLISCFIVLVVVLYHFEVAPAVTITWENNYNSNDPVKQPAPDKQEQIHNDPDYGVDIDPYDSDAIDEMAEEIENIVQGPVATPKPPVPIRHAPTDPPIEHGSPQKSGLSLVSTLPKTLGECFPAEIILTSNNELNYATQLYAMEELYLLVTCKTIDTPDPEFTKTIPFIPDTKKTFKSVFFPDSSTTHCSLIISSPTGIYIEGSIKQEYDVGEIPKERPWCWNCESHIYRNVPLAPQFMLMDNEGVYLFARESKTLQRDETLDLWIVPHPLLRTQYPEIIKKLLFNAWLESPHVIQGTSVSYTYDEGHGGYRIRIIGKDAGELKLFVVLNWIYPFSEVGSDDPEPILTSSHIEHSVSPCDLERSEITGSQFEIKVKVEGDKDHELELFIVPETPRKCTSINEPGRWLNVMPRETDCRPPYCSGDRFSSFISTMSWQGTKHEWLWIPYECHYHYYNADDFSTCAKELDINWIHVMGDSLPREFVAYLMSLNDVLDTTKFDHADAVLGDSGVRISFESWADIVGRGDIFGDSPRSKEFIATIIDHYNIRSEDSSQKIDMWKYSLYQDEEEETPDVVLTNSANAYAMFLQSTKSYQTFIEDFVDVLGDSLKNGRNADGKKVKMFWYGNPYIHGTAHAGTEFVTQGRNENFNKVAEPLLKEAGVNFFDVFHITQMRPQESWDGLHYLRGYERWNGHVASTFIQAWLNELFGSCTGDSG